MTATRPIVKLVAPLSLAAMLVLGTMTAQADEQEKETRNVLLITGEDYPGHVWKETAPVLRAQLDADARMTVDILTDLKKLATTDLSKYDAVVLHFKNYDPEVPGRKGFDNLAQFVKQGGGLMMLHFACGAFEEFKSDFEPVAGRVWFGMQPPPGRSQHDPHGQFTVHVADKDHPITKGMADFQTSDELYTCLEGDAPITVLATAVSKLDGKTYPMAFVYEYGKGRVFQSVLGHDAAAFRAPGPAELHQRGCAWIARLEPVPASDK